MIRTIEWRRGRVVMLDQRLLPEREVYRVYDDFRDVARAIRDMVIRGAPAIGVAAAMGAALGARRLPARRFAAGFERICRTLLAARPTAVNLGWAVERMRRVVREHPGEPVERLRDRLELEALAIHHEDVAVNHSLGRHGAPLLPSEGTVLTYCNAGALATAGYGTALGVIRRAREIGKRISVIACETRPFLQGARLTAWELNRDRIPCTLVTDNMVGHLMQRGGVDAVIVGTDRTAANGDVANKIGTYMLAALAARHRLPFYVAAPTSSIDLETARGADIPIEERSAEEVTHVAGQRIAPPGIAAYNPAFDVTPAPLITAIITERGVARPPYRKSLLRLVRPPAAKRPRRERGGV
ncbi:MAG TPA: S-methyl-5-thioribose-1-phosphate isomerase [Candidatus Binatia bacterium]|nr:S-methyl-5-thioribose-1-phosphate isomerase [Candidatus Binatia bacterium]